MLVDVASFELNKGDVWTRVGSIGVGVFGDTTIEVGLRELLTPATADEEG